ncbi:LrgB family protein [Aciduricibacillus chroicocephali]|uniref:LrgB family protein n=1 Tax=Aciduricibacillus chroicocephali TaxID=3054939 RepID=A0ABY9KT70_9BACI|nr:LrgB family protein [Bacillaceae bacterium 44XB]
MLTFVTGILSIIGTIFIYMLARKISQKYPGPFTIPVLIGTVMIIALLFVLRIPYDVYAQGANWINHLLGPAVVALAYPLYKQWDMLKRNIVPILSGVVVGAISGVASGLILTKLAHIDQKIALSLTPKNVTTPVAMDIAHTIGGVPALAAVFVMFAGIGGAVMSPYLFKLARIRHFLGKGIGIGCASHAIGIAMAMEHSEEEGAAGTVAMGLSSIVVSIITQPLIWLIY